VRVVLDTNVLISACLKPDGLEAEMVRMAVDGTILACITEEVLNEYREVLLRDKFQGVRGRAEAILGDLERRALVVVSGVRVAAAKDEDDNRLLECAEAARAEYLVTGNLRDYPDEWAGTRVVNARSFYEANNAGKGA